MKKQYRELLMQYKNPANRELVLEGLKMTGRMDLVGYGPKCLIRPLRENHGGQQHTQGSSRNAKNSRNSKITKTVQHLQRRTLSEIYIRKIPEEDVSDRKEEQK